MKKTKKITLIVLVVTIIILLILSLILILRLNGKNELFANVKLQKQKYSIYEAKEKLEFKITELRLEIEGKDEALTKEHLPKLNSYEIDVRSTEKFPVQVICDNYKFSVDENFIVTHIGEADGTIITYTTTPVGYTNKDEVEILIKASNPKGIKTIEYPNDNDKLLVDGQTEIGIDYKVTENGIYTFKIIDNEDKEITKEVVIDNFDKLKPTNVEIKTKEISITSFKIEVDAKDSEETEGNSKSGISRYEYYINGTKYESDDEKYTITGLNRGTQYTVYVRAYDRADNYLDSEIINVKTLEKPNAPKAKLDFEENENATIKALEYPILNSEGIFNCEIAPDIGEVVKLEITSPKIDDIKYYYSIDGGKTWNEYSSTVNIIYEENTEIMVKATCKENESIESTYRSIKKYKKDLTYECTAKDALKKEAYDDDIDTYTTLNGFQILLVDDTAIGLEIKAKWYENDGTRTINAFASEKFNYWELLWYIGPQGNKIVQEGTAIILEDTKSIISYTNSAGAEPDLLYEISLLN